MACCAVKNCLNNRKFPPQGKTISFHLFPKGELQQVWLNKLGKTADNFVWTKNKVVCSEHFKQDDFIQRAGRKYLKFNSVPSLKLSTVQDPFSIIESSISRSSPSQVKVATFNREVSKEKLCRAKEKINRLKKMVTHLKFTIKNLKSNYGVSSFDTKYKEKNYEEVPDALLSQILKSNENRAGRGEFPDVLEKLAIIFHIHSSKGYDYVRRNFNLVLPHPSIS